MDYPAAVSLIERHNSDAVREIHFCAVLSDARYRNEPFRGLSVHDWQQNGVFIDVRSMRWMNDRLSVQRNGADRLRTPIPSSDNVSGWRSLSHERLPGVFPVFPLIRFRCNGRIRLSAPYAS